MRSRLHINRSRRFFLFLTAIFSFTIILFSNNSIYASRLYFDENGNLVFVATDGKDTSGVKYRTIGWVLKRYDLPMEAPGQQYTIIQKRVGGNSYTDPNNPNIIISVLKSDRNEILNAIGRVSNEWKNQLIDYGGDVYIDSVMTVVVNDVELGAVGKNGELSGEVYCKYEEFAVARPWGDPPSLRQYYDMVVEYPPQVEVPQQTVSVSRQNISYTSPVINTVVLGSNKENFEIYDISRAIPGGESIYAKGSISSFFYEAKLSLVRGTISVPVKVSTTYILKWKDYYGNDKQETRIVDRYYVVRRDFEYYQNNNTNMYTISSIKIANEALEDGEIVKRTWINTGKAQTIYGDVMSHISVDAESLTVDGGTKILISDTYIKPAIPTEDYQRMAEQTVKELNVKSDRIVVGNITLLSDEICKKKGKAPIYFTPTTATIYITDIKLSKLARNKLYDSLCSLVYKNTSSNDEKTASKTTTGIKIHTPIVCEGAVIEDKSNNQEITPVENTIVAGCEFEIYTACTGKHSDYKGYGVGNYEKYLGRSEICFPFEVERNGVLYEKMTWIDLSEGKQFTLPYDVNIGKYEIIYRNYAINAKDNDTLGSEYSNAANNGYFAYSVEMVHVTGRIYDFTVNNEYKVKDLVFCEENQENEIEFTMLVAGDYNEGDMVRVEYEYDYYLDGQKLPVKVYVVENRDGISKGELRLADEYSQVSICEGEEEGQNLTKIKDTITLGNEVYIFPKDIEITGAKDIVKNYSEALEGGVLTVTMDITVYRENEPFISYINEENCKNGYCNMWQKEGFHYNQMLGNERVELKDGEAICFFGERKEFLDYRVVGTH